MLPTLFLVASLAAGAPSPRPSPPASPGEREAQATLALPLPGQRVEREEAMPAVTLALPLPGQRAGREEVMPAVALALPLPAPSLVLPLPAQRGEGRGGGLRQYDDYDDDDPQYDDEEDDRRRPRLLVSGWGGEALAQGGSGRSSSFYGGELAWAFSQLDLGVSGSWYRSLRDATRAWTPVVLTRVTQRFMTRRGFEAAFSLGLGAGRPSGWIGWYQVALGIRLPLGPLFVGGELAFEQYDILRLGAGLGVGF